ncbi:MAG: sensor histidine kinase [Alphaproteobacteria bacterium]|nr:sensor histidine kinase [Alphaproteobacteria bacterium]
MFKKGIRKHSTLTRRILILNVLTLLIPVFGLLYQDQYRQTLINDELDDLKTQSVLFANALGMSTVNEEGKNEQENFLPEIARSALIKLAAISHYRARLFSSDGELLSDSARFDGPGGLVEVETLPLVERKSFFENIFNYFYDLFTPILPKDKALDLYHEAAKQNAHDYSEVLKALEGEVMSVVRRDHQKRLVLTVASPVQRYRKVLAALLLSSDGTEIEQDVREFRYDIIRIFTVGLFTTILLSLILAGTIARPIQRLARAAEQVRYLHIRNQYIKSNKKQGPDLIPDFTYRNDEIGDLSLALREMTKALYKRMNAIESFAADVAHEIKNPLTSLRSAVETVNRVDDPEKKKKLLALILDDVERLNRLISDISEASRVDADISKNIAEPVNMLSLVRNIAHSFDMGSFKNNQDQIFSLKIDERQEFKVLGIESRLEQVLYNIINNAISFSPPQGIIELVMIKENQKVIITIKDQGPGIPEDKLDKIFERFYTARPIHEKFGVHSGLGLSISKQIIEAHNGIISVCNVRDENDNMMGAEFRIELPLLVKEVIYFKDNEKKKRL